MELYAPPEGPLRPKLDLDLLAPLLRGEDVVLFNKSVGEGFLFTYVAASVAGRPTALELVKSLREEQAYLKTTILRITFAAVAIAIVSGLIAMVLGDWLVSRPTRKLVQMT